MTDPGADALVAAETRRVAALRMRLLEEHAFWGYLLLQVEMIPNLELPAIAATDCVRRIWYNPRLTQPLRLNQLGFVLAHEVGHHIYATLDRQRGRDPHLWNCATDYAINRIVADIDDPTRSWPRRKMYEPPSGILLDARFDGMIAERIYDVLAKDASGLGEPTPVDVPLDGGVLIPGVPDHGGGIDVHLPGARSPSEREGLADRIRAAVEHWRQNDERGKLPGIVERYFGGARARVPWQTVFRSFVSQARSREEYDPRRPNRRWLEAGTVLPSRGGESMGLVVVALDTSGSMTGGQIASFIAEIRALSREVDDLRLVVCDSVVQETLTLDQLGPWLAASKAKGGGGTSHVPVFEWVAQQRLDVEVFVGLTDLYTVFPTCRPAFPVLWVVPSEHGPAPFGRVLELGG
ncbi:MAG: hypothetical protein EXR69_11720 [Myxococcales bacterium]|nr:hypothetical protein [Myxococcales bacterium]